MPLTVTLSKVIKLLLHIICLSLFIAYAVSIIQKYFDDFTATLVDIFHEDELLLPAVTICAVKPFKKANPLLSENDLLEVTYAVEELIHEGTLKVRILFVFLEITLFIKFEFTETQK